MNMDHGRHGRVWQSHVFDHLSTLTHMGGCKRVVNVLVTLSLINLFPRYEALSSSFPESCYLLAQTALCQYNRRHFDESQEMFESLRKADPHRLGTFLKWFILDPTDLVCVRCTHSYSYMVY